MLLFVCWSDVVLWWTNHTSFLLYTLTQSLDEYMADQLAGMEYDGYPSTHPIVVPVISPDDSSDVFDEITYEKGASILLMISKYIDETQGMLQDCW